MASLNVDQYNILKECSALFRAANNLVSDKGVNIPEEDKEKLLDQIREAKEKFYNEVPGAETNNDIAEIVVARGHLGNVLAALGGREESHQMQAPLRNDFKGMSPEDITAMLDGGMDMEEIMEEVEKEQSANSMDNGNLEMEDEIEQESPESTSLGDNSADFGTASDPMDVSSGVEDQIEQESSHYPPESPSLGDNSAASARGSEGAGSMEEVFNNMLDGNELSPDNGGDPSEQSFENLFNSMCDDNKLDGEGVFPGGSIGGEGCWSERESVVDDVEVDERESDGQVNKGNNLDLPNIGGGGASR